MYSSAWRTVIPILAFLFNTGLQVLDLTNTTIGLICWGAMVPVTLGAIFWPRLQPWAAKIKRIRLRWPVTISPEPSVIEEKLRLEGEMQRLRDDLRDAKHYVERLRYDLEESERQRELMSEGMDALLASQPETWGLQPIAPVEGKSYRNEKVELDGHSFSSCKFENVTFVYKGEHPFNLDPNNNEFVGSYDIEARGPQLQSLVLLLGQLEALNPNWKRLGNV